MNLKNEINESNSFSGGRAELPSQRWPSRLRFVPRSWGNFLHRWLASQEIKKSPSSFENQPLPKLLAVCPDGATRLVFSWYSILSPRGTCQGNHDSPQTLRSADDITRDAGGIKISLFQSREANWSRRLRFLVPSFFFENIMKWTDEYYLLESREAPRGSFSLHSFLQQLQFTCYYLFRRFSL